MRKFFSILIVLTFPVPVWSQLYPDVSVASGFISTGFSFQQWSINESDHPIREIVFPVTAFVPLRERLYLNVSNSPAVAQHHEAKLEGLSDTWMRVTYILPGDRIMANVGVGAPTGKTGLTEEEFDLSQHISENAYRFRLPNYGQGFSTKVGLAMAYPLREKYVLGVGINFVYKSAYHPLEDRSVEYQPGNEAGLFFGIDAQLGEIGKWNCDVIYTIYGVDRLSGEKIFGSGNKLMINSSLLVNFGEDFLWTTLRWRQKGKNEFWTGTSLEPESKNSNGNQLEVDAMWQFMKWREGAFRFLIEGRYHSKNEYGKRWALVFGGGLGLVYPLSPKIFGNLNVKFLKGSLRSLETMNQTGIDFFGGVVYQF